MKENRIYFTPVHSYLNADLQKSDICRDNNNKTGIYKWTHIISGKSYIGSAINLSNKLKNYYNIYYLERKIIKNNSMIYKALLKYGYSNFKLDIIEYCNPNILIEREQYYFDLLKPEYNILKLARSMKRFKHSKKPINIMNIANNNDKVQSIIVKNNKIGDSYIAKTIKINKIYVGKIHIITKQ